MTGPGPLPLGPDAGPVRAAATRRTPRAWRLRTHLTALLVTTIVLTLAGVGSATMALRIPVVEHKSRQALDSEVREFGERMELLLSAAHARLQALEYLLDAALPAQRQDILDKTLNAKPAFAAIYWLSPEGRVIGVGVAPAWQAERDALMGSDLSAHRVFQAARAAPGVVWHGRAISALTGARTVGVGVRDAHGHVLVAELPVSALTETVEVAAGSRPSHIWVVERSGEIIADTDRGTGVGRHNLRDWPLMQALHGDSELPVDLQFEGRRWHAAVAHAPALDWYFVGRAPTGLANPQVRVLLLYGAAALAGCLPIALLIAPLWANRMARPLRRIVERAAQTGSGLADTLPWPRGPVLEFNRLASDLEEMAHTLQQREQTSQALFNASPVAMALVDLNDGARMLDVNQAWVRSFGWQRAQAIGRTAVALGLWTAQARDAFLRDHDGEHVAGETTVMRANGEAMQAQVVARRVTLGRERWMIWAVVDIGPLRRGRQALRELNRDLEARVQQRTQALASSHDELSATLERLRAAQAELVNAEKLAALGGLVAGVAHEVNTPLGNGVMAISAMAGVTASFRQSMQSGLRRADLMAFLDSIGQGTDIAERNLRRAADLVHTFKQVAVDQTSAQRRRFELGEVVHETVVSLQPRLTGTPYRVEIDVPATGLALDSYPGALGQALANLVHNAVLHGFDGRDHGTVRITGARAADGHIVLRVIDDGQGIAADLIGRVFEPFVTTRMGRGGTGLGLHVSYNTVVHVLGGTLTVQSTPGQGAAFELRLPAQAPRPQPDAAARPAA